jgi:transposase
LSANPSTIPEKQTSTVRIGAARIGAATTDEMARLYDENLSLKEVGARLGFSGAGVYKALTRAGKKLRPRGAQNVGRFKLTEAQENEIVQLYYDGDGLASRKIAALFGVSKPTVLTILRKKGSVIRDQSIGELPWEELKARYEGNPGVTLLALAKEYGVAYQTMRLGLLEVGCKLRPKAPEGNTRFKEWREKLERRSLPADLADLPDTWQKIIPELIADRVAGGNISNKEVLAMLHIKASKTTMNSIRKHCGVPGPQGRRSENL